MNTDFSYFKNSESADYPFVKVPRELFFGQKFSGLSADAKVLYMAMLERQSLSQKNDWRDSEGNIYIIFTHADAMEYFKCSRCKVIKSFAELDVKSGIGLIKRKRQGQGKPDIIYLNSNVFENNQQKNIAEELTADNQMNNKKTSECLNNKQPDVLNTDTNNINNNKNNIKKNNYNNPSFHISPENWIEERNEYKEIIKQNIDYNNLIEEHRKTIVDEIIKAMVNAICSQKDFIRISNENIPKEEIKRRFLTMNALHIGYVYDCVMKNKSSVRNIGAFLLTCLYRAFDNVEIFYQLKANEQMCNLQNCL